MSSRGIIHKRDRRAREDECADWGALWHSANREPEVRNSTIERTIASPSAQSEILELRARIRDQDERIAEMKSQALQATQTIDSLVRLKAEHEIDKRSYKSDLARANKDYETDLAREQRYYESDLASAKRWHQSSLDLAQTFYKSSLQKDRTLATADYESHNHTLNAFANYFGRPPPEAVALQVPPLVLDNVFDVPLVFTEPLTSVRVVGESRLRGCVDVLPLISTFLLTRGPWPLDVAVTRVFLHMTRWLLANGAEPTTLTVHAAISGGNLDIVKAVFSSIDSVEPKPELFQELPINQSEPIALWLLQTYPLQMAKEFVRLSSLEKMPSRCQWAWYAERVKQQWHWEQDFASQCVNRKRQRLEHLSQN